MANTDSFINEVTEEVRRDRLYTLLRRWGWIGALAIIILVGGAAWNEYRRVQDTAQAEAFGNALLAALELPTTEARIAALAEIEAEDPNATLILALLQAGEESEGDDSAAAAARLRSAAEGAGIADRYRDLALLKAHLLDPLPMNEAMFLLDRLARPGAPYRGLALEQQAYLQIAAGETEAGLALLQQLQEDAAATPGLQQRALQLIVALEAGSSLSDNPPPEPEAAPVEAAPAPAVAEPSEETDTPAETDGTDPSGTETDTDAAPSGGTVQDQ